MQTMKLFYFLTLLLLAQSQTLYNHNSNNSYRNQTWMSLFDNGIPLRNLNILGTHSSMSTGQWGDAFQTQSLSLLVQMESGVRALDIRCRHYYNTFRIHERLINLGEELDDVLDTVSSFLSSYPNEVILMHIVEEYNAKGNSQTFEQTFISYKNSYSDLIWEPTTQNPTLGMTRGKVVIIQDFDGNSIHGLLYNSFSILSHKNFGTNWDQYDKWLDVKGFLTSANNAGSSYLGFWTGSVGSFPYFVASGKSSPQNGAPRLATGLTTPGFKSYYPDFPRVACFIGICTIAFEGINTLAYDYFTGRSYDFVGIVFTDFFGDSLIQKVLNMNSNLFGVCSTTQKDRGCTVCSVDGDCVVCDEQNNYVFQSSSCAAAPGYYLNSTFFPELCSQAMTGCLECDSQTVCTLCDTYIYYELSNGSCIAAPGYYLDADSIPVKCSITGCYLCSSASVCTQCSSANNFEMDVNGDCVCNSTQNFAYDSSSGVCVCDTGYYLQNNTCIPVPVCPSANSGCSNCSGSICSSCDTGAGFVSESTYCVCDDPYYFDGATCQFCNSSHAPCQTCESADLCTSCVQNFTLTEGVCECTEQYYSVDSDTCHSCPIGCLKCTGSASCERCDQNASFVLKSGVCECQTGKYLQTDKCVVCGSMPGCLDCNMMGCIQCDPIFGFSLNGTECVCDPGYYISSMAVCTACPQEGCVQCDSATVCTLCDNSSYYLDGIECAQVCGDGKLFNLQCDDGNVLDGDGCSSNCETENDYTCSGGSSISPSGCSYSGTVEITIDSVVKSQRKNEVIVKLNLAPALLSFEDINFQECLETNFPYATRQTHYDSSTGQINFTFTYDTSLNTKEMEVTFDPPETPQFFYTPTAKVGMPYSTDNNLGLKYYDDEVYELWPTMMTLVQVLLYFTVATFILGFFFSSKLMAVEMITVLQIAFIGLLLIDKLQALMDPLKQLWPVNGYNGIVQDNNPELPSRVVAPYYKGLFFANFNLNFIFIVWPLLIGLIIYVIGKVKKEKVLLRAGSKAMKEYQLSVLLVFQFHLIISICLAIMYGVDTIFGIVLGMITLVGLVIYCPLLYFRPLNFGEYKSFFQRTHKLKINYYIIVILFRLLIPIAICSLNQSKASVYFTLSLCLLQALCLCVIRPYKSNFRPILNSIVILITMIFYGIYRLSITDQSQWITTYLPIFLVSLIFLTVIINVIFMIQFTVKKCKKKKQSKAQFEMVKKQDDSMFQQAERNWKLIHQMMQLGTPKSSPSEARKFSVKGLANKNLNADKDSVKEMYDAI